MTQYLHGYSESEGNRLAAQAEFWRDRLMLPGTHVPAGTRLLEVGCGVGAVLGVLNSAFPGLRCSGVDIEPKQIAAAEHRLGRAGISADLRVADGRELPYADASFDHVWFQFVLEHLDEDGSRKALEEARRVLAPGGQLTAIEADYHSLRSDPPVDMLTDELARRMDTFGQADAGPRLNGWLHEGGWSDVDPGAHHFVYRGAAARPVVAYVTDVMSASKVDTEDIEEHTLDLIEFVVHKATALKSPGSRAARRR